MALSKVNQKKLDGFVERLTANDVLGMSAAVAFYTVLSMTPFLLLFFAFVAALGWQDIPRINSGIAEIMGPVAKVVLESLQVKFRYDSGGIAFGLFGLATLLFSASGVISQLQYSLEALFRPLSPVKEKDESTNTLPPPSYFRIWLWTRLNAILAMIFCIFVASVSLILSVVIEVFLPIQNQSHWNTINRFGAILFFFTIFSMMFRYLPQKNRPSWKICLKGGALCSLLFHLGKGALAFYVTRAGIESSYGALSSFIVFLLWAYYNALIILLSGITARSFFED